MLEYVSESKNMNMRGVFLHIATDTAGSVFVVISSLFACIFTESPLIYYIDPALRFLTFDSIFLVLFSFR